MRPYSLMRGISIPMFAENGRNRNRSTSRRRRPRLESLEERQLLSTGVPSAPTSLTDTVSNATQLNLNWTEGTVRRNWFPGSALY